MLDLKDDKMKDSGKVVDSNELHSSQVLVMNDDL